MTNYEEKIGEHRHRGQTGEDCLRVTRDIQIVVGAHLPEGNTAEVDRDRVAVAEVSTEEIVNASDILMTDDTLDHQFGGIEDHARDRANGVTISKRKLTILLKSSAEPRNSGILKQRVPE
uniref:Uncharacterized protein n=1 Tax=Bracon brevicornis TaxID=1563983 RepID=A0A6V7MBG3_9HYME